MKFALAQLAALVFITASTTTERLQAAPPGPIAQFPVADDGDVLLLPVSLGGEQYPFLLDTGAEVTVCDSRLGDKLRSAGGEVRLGTVSRLVISATQTMDLTWVRQVSGRDVMGILGMDALHDLILQLDVDAGKVRVLPKTDATCGVPVRLTNEAWQCPCVVARLGRTSSASFILDTGTVSQGSGALRAPLFDSLISSGALHEMRVSLDRSFAGKTAQRNASLAAFAIDNFDHRDLRFSRQTENLLGLNYLSRYIVTFDFPNRVLYLREGKRFGSPDVQDRSGLHIRRVDQLPTVESVDPGSPADKAEMLPGDQIVFISNRDVQRLTLFSIRKLLCQPGTEIMLAVRRGGSDVFCRLALLK